jgi:flavin reductase (DIM6/NTAB) family NADH-FMN oxidoreductase RutF
VQQPATIAEAIGRKYPEQIVIVIAKDASGRHNPITIGWTMLCSYEPLMMAIGVAQSRWSADAIRQSRQFVISYVSAGMVDDVEFHGTHSGRDMDKLAAKGTPTQPATKIDSVILADAVANFECELRHEMPTGDHLIFVGEVVAAHVNRDATLSRLYSRGGDLALGAVKPVV